MDVREFHRVCPQPSGVRARSYQSVLSAVLVAALSGCAAFQGYPNRATDPDADLRVLEPEIGAAAITACLDAPAISCRNKIIAARMHANDIRFSQFEENLFRQTREAGFSATLATLGLTTSAAFVSGGASQILAGIAAFIIGGREAFQKEVLAERTVIAIHTAMRARRAQTALRLRAGLRQSLDDYPLALGLADLDDYYNGGTVLGALIGITETVGVEARQAEQNLRELTSGFVRDDPGDLLRTLWKPDGENINLTNQKAIRDWMDNNGLVGESITFFMRATEYSTARQRAVTDLGLE